MLTSLPVSELSPTHLRGDQMARGHSRRWPDLWVPPGRGLCGRCGGKTCENQCELGVHKSRPWWSWVGEFGVAGGSGENTNVKMLGELKQISLKGKEKKSSLQRRTAPTYTLSSTAPNCSIMTVVLIGKLDNSCGTQPKPKEVKVPQRPCVDLS